MTVRGNQAASNEKHGHRHGAECAAILDALPAYVGLLDREGTIVAVNESWRRFTAANGWGGEDAGIGQNYLELCDVPQAADASEAANTTAGIRAVLAGERASFSVEYPCHSPDEARWFQMTATPVERLAGGGVVVMHWDITRRRNAEEELARTSRLLSIACRTGRMGGWTVDLASQEIEWSDEVAAIHDLPAGTNPSADEAISFYAPEWQERIHELFEVCARDGTPFDQELEIISARGVRKWVRAIGDPVRGEDGVITGVHGAFQDLTPAKEAEAALALSQRRFHQLAETLPQIVWTAEPHGNVDFISGNFYRLTGLERVDPAAQEWLEAIHPDDRERSKRTLHEAMQAGIEFQVELRLFCAAEHDYRWHVSTARPVRNDAGAIVKWYGAAIDIHDRWMAEEALAEAQQQTRLILAASGEGIHGLDAEGRINFDNPAALAMLGYELEELIGQPGHDLIHHHHADGRAYRVEDCPKYQTLRDGWTRHVEGEVFFRKDGSSFPVDYTCAPMIDEATGAITGAVVNFRDVTEKKRAEGLHCMETRVLDMISAGQPLDGILEETARGIDSLLPEVMSSVLLIDDEGRLRHGAAPGLPGDYNAAIDGIAVGPGAGSCGTAAHWREPVIVADIETDPLWQGYRELARPHGLAACWATPVLDADGRVLATLAMYYPAPRTPTAGELGVAERVAQFVRVAIERTRQHEAIKVSEERFRVIARATSDVLWDRDIAANRVWWSDGMLTQFGHETGALPVGPEFWSDSIHPDDRARVVSGIHAVIDDPTRNHWQDEYRFVCADGATAWIIDRGHVIRDARGTGVRMVGSMVDVTEQRRLEEQLRQAQRLEAIGKLTGGVAHDFNNLLTVILGNAEILAERLGDDADLRTLADMIRTASERGAELTGRLLAFGRRQPLDPRPTDVNRLISGMEDLLRRTLGEQVELEIVHEDGLWPAMADEAQLESAILNLCINARDAMPSGGRLSIETANTRLDDHCAAQHPEVTAGQYVLVAVSDTGEGMDADTLAQAFEPFFTTKEVGKGSGLGLSQVYGFAKQSQGHVRIHSEPGQGTTVQLYLPRACSEAAAEPETPASDAADDGTERILLVEDEDLVREHVAAQLVGLGYTVTTARSGAEALAALHEGERFDLLFTDVVMPGGMSGRDLAEQALALHPELPVLFTTGYTESAIVHQGRLDAGVLLLQKPYRREDLAAKVRAALNRGHD